MNNNSLNSGKNTPEHGKNVLSVAFQKTVAFLDKTFGSKMTELTEVYTPIESVQHPQKDLEQLMTEGEMLMEKNKVTRSETPSSESKGTSLPDFVNQTPRKPMTAADAAKIEAVHQGGDAFGPSETILNLRPGKEVRAQQKTAV